VAGAALLLLPLTRQSSAPRPSSGPRYSREEAAQYDQQRDRIIAEKESLKGLQFRLNVRIGHWQSAALTKAQDCEVSRALALLSSDQGLTRHSGTPSFSAPLAVADAQVGPESAKTASVATVLNASPEIYELHQFGTDFQVWEYGDRVYSLTPTQAIVAKELSDFKRHSLSVLRGKVGDGWDSIDDVFTKRKDNPGRIEFWECFVQKFGDPPSMVQLSKIPLKPLS
jgi:hypothetical protein